ncbi:MAG: LysM peptidoglycan-binding domain-containing protein [Gemmatimonadales bacterium]
MERTTICRSSRAVLLALVAAPLAAPALIAQDTLQATPAQAPLAQIPTSHTVVQGETLWSIATLYFGDPLLWPEIYRLNPAIIEDPHWIYPGEVLVLAPLVGETVAQGPVTDTTAAQPQAADTVVAAPTDTLVVDTTQAVIEEPPPPPPGEAYRTIFERNRSRTVEVQNILRAYADQPYRPLRRGEFYAAGFLTEYEALPWARVVGNTASPPIHRLSDRTSATQFDEIAIQPPNGASYHVGDSLLLARIDRDEPNWGGVVVPVGVARVTSVQEDQVLAQVITQFFRIRDGQVALPLEPFKDPGQVRPTPVEQGLQARLIAPRELRPLVSTQQFLFIDKGRAEGVVPGDVFELYTPATGEPGTPSEEVRTTLMVVHTRERSSTALVIGIRNPQVEVGMPVRLIKKMPS